MADLVFVSQPPAKRLTMFWIVRDRSTDEVVGSVEWHDHLGEWGFAPIAGASVFFDATAASQVGTFLRGLSAPARDE